MIPKNDFDIIFNFINMEHKCTINKYNEILCQCSNEKEFGKIEINFDKPFFYMIRDSKTKEVLFMGGVYKPNLWKGITCENA